MLVLLTQLGHSVYTQFESDGLICATKLCSNLFTIFAIDILITIPVLVLQKTLGMEQHFFFQYSTSNQRQMG